jgi:hypothetical protein
MSANRKRLSRVFLLSTAAAIVAALGYVGWRQAIRPHVAPPPQAVVRRPLPSEPVQRGIAVSELERGGDDPAAICSRLHTASPELVAWVSRWHSAGSAAATQRLTNEQRVELDRICAACNMPFADWNTLAVSFRGGRPAAPIVKAAILQGCRELPLAGADAARTQAICDELWKLSRRLPTSREYGPTHQSLYEALMPFDPQHPTHFQIAAYLRTEAIDRQGRHAEAADALRQLIERRGEHLPKEELANWEYKLGSYLFWDEKYELAIPRFRAGVTTVRGNHRNESLSLLVISLVRIDRLDEARMELTRLRKEFSKNRFLDQATSELTARLIARERGDIAAR